MLHSHAPLSHVPWPLQALGHAEMTAVPQSAPVYPASHVQPNGPGSQRTPSQRGPHEPWPLHMFGQPAPVATEHGEPPGGV
eukprot:6244812-Prymnesium_polylepis.1